MEGNTTFRGSRRAIKCNTTGTVIAARPNNKVAFRNVTVRCSYGRYEGVKWTGAGRCFNAGRKERIIDQSALGEIELHLGAR